MKAKAGKCQRCGVYRWKLDRDHIVPKAHGGTDDPSNIQYLCQNCHCDKTFLEDKVHSSPEARERQRQNQLGKRWSDESKEKLRQSQLGHVMSEETKEKLRQTNKEHLERLRLFHLGRKRSPEVGQRISAAKLGVPIKRGAA